MAQVGTGAWGANLVRNFGALAECNLKLLCDTDERSLARALKFAPGAKTTPDPQAIADDESIEAVAVASPAVTHYELAKKFLAAGKDVFVEKPMTLRAVEAEELVQLAESQKRILMVGHLLLFHPAVVQLTTLLRNGELGQPRYVYSQRTNLGKVRPDENAMWSFAPHDLAVMLHFLDSEPEDVSARGEDFLQDGIQDVVFLYLRFPEGYLAHAHVSWLDPHKVRRTTVVGSKKMAVFDDQEPTEKLRIYDKGVDAGEVVDYARSISVRSGDIWVPRIDMTEPLRLECRHFLECVRTRNTPLTDGRHGLRVIRVLDAAARSLEQGGVPVRTDSLTAAPGPRGSP
jgi:predicted dehydrogenase